MVCAHAYVLGQTQEAFKPELKLQYQPVSADVRLSAPHYGSHWPQKAEEIQDPEFSGSFFCPHPLYLHFSLLLFFLFFCRVNGVKHFCPVSSPMVIYCICVGQLLRYIVHQSQLLAQPCPSLASAKREKK